MNLCTISNFSCLLLVGLTLFQCGLSQERVSYDGYQLIRALAVSEDQGHALLQLLKNDEDLDFWKPPSLNQFTDIMAHKDKTPKIMKYLQSHNIESQISNPDLGKTISQQSYSYPKQGNETTMSWDQYHSLQTVYEWFQNLTQFYPDTVEVINIGKSYEERDLKVVRVSRNLTLNNPAIFIDSTIHAREWITLAAVTFMMNELLTNPSDNSLLDEVDFYFLPILNPDGYEYSTTTDRLWRKTRSVIYSSCRGTDANRNFGYMWDSCDGCSSGSCSAMDYRGPSAFSEPETNATRVFIEEQKSLGVNFQAFITVHSYSQLFMLPWGYTPEYPTDYAELKSLADQVAGNITAMFGTRYTTGNSYNTVYPTDGSSLDWAYGSGLFKYAFTAELRDLGEYGFLLPPAQILPTAQESWAGFKVLVRHIVGK